MPKSPLPVHYTPVSPCRILRRRPPDDARLSPACLPGGRTARARGGRMRGPGSRPDTRDGVLSARSMPCAPDAATILFQYVDVQCRQSTSSYCSVSYPKCSYL